MFTLLTQEKRIQGSITYTSLDLEEIQRCFARLPAGEEGLVKILLTP